MLLVFKLRQKDIDIGLDFLVPDIAALQKFLYDI